MSTLTPTPIGRIVFACGAGIPCKPDKLDLFPVGKRHITWFKDAPRPKMPDGTGVHCLFNCPCSERESGALVTRAWAADDDTSKTEPSFMVRCRIKRHEIPS